MKIYVLTSDVTSWALRPFLHLMGKYWPEHPPIMIAGYTRPEFLPPEQFMSLGNFEDFPVNRWSDGLALMLQKVDEECFIWTMDDFWPIRPVKHQAVVDLFNHAVRNKELARVDLTSDRAGAATARVLTQLYGLDIVGTELPSQYHLSFQASIWRTSALQAYTVPGETGWQMELDGTNRMNLAAANVIGTLQEPMKYVIAVQKGKLTLDGGYQGKDHALPQEDYDELIALGML